MLWYGAAENSMMSWTVCRFLWIKRQRSSLMKFCWTCVSCGNFSRWSYFERCITAGINNFQFQQRPSFLKRKKCPLILKHKVSEYWRINWVRHVLCAQWYNYKRLEAEHWTFLFDITAAILYTETWCFKMFVVDA